MPAGYTDCGSYACKGGTKCSAGGGCVPKESADCGGGHYCANGLVCIGTEKCGTQQQADAWREQEKRKQEEKVKAAEEAKRQQAEQQQSLRDQIKKSDASQKQGLKEQLQNKLKDAQEAKQAPPDQNPGSTSTTITAPQQAAASVSPGSPQTAATVLNPGAQAGPQASVATVTPPTSTPARAPSYTFSQTQYGTVEVFQNGKRISTMTPQAAATQYGYQLPSGTLAQSPQTTAAPIATGPVTTPSGAIVDASTGKLIAAPPAANANAAAGQAPCSAWGSFDSSGSASGTTCGNTSPASIAGYPTATVQNSTPVSEPNKDVGALPKRQPVSSPKANQPTSAAGNTNPSAGSSSSAKTAELIPQPKTGTAPGSLSAISSNVGKSNQIIPPTGQSVAGDRDALWPKKGVPPDAQILPIDKAKGAHDWEPIQLASIAYNDKLQPGDVVFKNNPDWKVLESKTDNTSSFKAYTFVNINDHRMVVAVQGSRDAKDWGQDLYAYRTGNAPAQFQQAERYVQDVKRRFGDRYAIDCVGHSLGGGACAYAAAKVTDVHGITITPVSPAPVITDQAYLIDNYLVKGDATNLAAYYTEEGYAGWKYAITGGPVAVIARSGISQSTPAVSEMLGGNPVTRHSVDRAIDAIGHDLGLQRLESAN